MRMPVAFWKPSGGTPAPVLSSLNYTQGDIAGGGQSIVATGTSLSSASAVTIGGNSATITGNTATSVTFTLPAHAAGAVTVAVTTPGGTSNTLSFTYWSPAQITGIDGYWDSNKGITLSGSQITQWVDQSVNAITMTGGGSGNQPVQTASVFGTMPSARFTPQQYLTCVTKRTLASGLSYFWVTKYTATTSTEAQPPNAPMTVIADHTGGVYNTAGENAGALSYEQYVAGWTYTTEGSGLNDGNPRLLGWTHDSGTGNLKAYSGATQLGSTASEAYNTTYNGYNAIGAGNALVDGANGDIGAVITVSGVIASGDLTNLNAWSRQRFGTP